jgi:hypothetical protein
MSVERDRLQQDGAAWRRWGPYLSERAWGTVREDYSATGEAWDAAGNAAHAPVISSDARRVVARHAN